MPNRGVMIGLVVVGCLLPLAVPVAPNFMIPPQSAGQDATSPAWSASANLQFLVSIFPQSNFSLNVSFDAKGSLSGGYVQSGERLNATAGMTFPNSAQFDITFLGTTVPLSINPIGLLYEVPIPGLTYGYEGIASLGLYLNLTGVVLANDSTTGPCSGGDVNLSWDASGSDSFPVNLSSEAIDGQSCTATLGPIEYGLAIGVDAIGSVLGFNVTVPILQFGQVGLVNASPQSINSSYVVGSPASSPSFALDSPARLGLVGGGVVAVGAVATILWTWAKGRQRRP